MSVLSLTPDEIVDFHRLILDDLPNWLYGDACIALHPEVTKYLPDEVEFIKWNSPLLDEEGLREALLRKKAEPVVASRNKGGVSLDGVIPEQVKATITVWKNEKSLKQLQKMIGKA